MTLYATENGAKPRYDGKGTEFGLMHRDLGPGYLMFDIDRLSAILEVKMELKRENECFIEHRLESDGVRFVAMFEVKHHKTQFSLEALNPIKSNTIVRGEIARRLGCRLFIVFASNGKQPFEFYEQVGNESYYIGTLAYQLNERQDAVKEFWTNVLGIDK